ncbi:MAG TPA: GNAT family N-acetyltransferase [Dehalococcoidia bacterium]|nr:GNAT family N-acetyltransferase [Dehalococcoidia bacterium]
MSIEYRQPRPDEMARVLYTRQLGFGNSTAQAEIDRRLGDAGWYPADAHLAAFAGDEVAARLTVRPFTVVWGRREIACGGLTGVVTSPAHRRRGHLRELLRRAFQRQREQEQALSMLWASMAAIYQRFGYGLGYACQMPAFDARRLAFVDEVATPGRVRLVPHAEVMDRIAPAYERFATPRTLMLRRSSHWWLGGLLRQWDPDDAPELIAAYEEAGEVRGYLLYHVEQAPAEHGSGNVKIEVRDLVWHSPAAHRALIQYLAAYDRAHTVLFNALPADDPLFCSVQEPRDLHTRAVDGSWLRLVDLPAALEGRGYAADGRLRFAVDDELCPWNSGVWELAVEGGAARVRRSGHEPELTLSPRALAMLSCGSATATLLARLGLLHGAVVPRTLATADALFRGDFLPYCMDHF